MPPCRIRAFADELRETGALLQVNAGSLLGRERACGRSSWPKLLQKELVTWSPATRTT